MGTKKPALKGVSAVSRREPGSSARAKKPAAVEPIPGANGMPDGTVAVKYAEPNQVRQAAQASLTELEETYRILADS
jgi:hypothetical protein